MIESFATLVFSLLALAMASLGLGLALAFRITDLERKVGVDPRSRRVIVFTIVLSMVGVLGACFFAMRSLMQFDAGWRDHEIRHHKEDLGIRP